MDWKAIVAELLEQHGMSQPQIAGHCGCAQSSISAIARGETKDPRHSLGEALKDLVAAKRREAAEKAVAAARPGGGAASGLAAPGGL